MVIIKQILNSFLFWGGWIIIPFIMEIVPALGSVFLLIRRNLRHKKKRKEMKIYPEISLIIPVYNSADTLYGCIKSVNDSTYPNDKIRIFLVNNKGQDNSFAVYADCQKKFPDLLMQWLNAEQGKSRALNLALYNSDGKYIINLDSDGILEKNALVNLITRFEQDTDLNCMTGAILTIPEQIQAYKGFFPRLLRNLEFMEYAQAFLAGRSYASEMNAVYTLSGAFSAFRKSVVLKSWMYNTDTICEDTHITFQMKYRQNERVEVCEDAIFFVDPIEDMNKLYTQRQRWQRGSLEVAKMFMDKSFKVKNIFSNVSVNTLAGYLYFIVVAYFLNINKDVKKYYVRHWWCILFLPFFNFLVFFIRVAGIINSIQTDSAWKTMNFTDECKAFAKVVKQDMQKPAAFIGKLRKAVNYEPMEDMELIEVEEADTPEAVDITEDKRNIMEDKTMAEDSKEAAEKIEQIGLIDEDESL